MIPIVKASEPLTFVQYKKENPNSTYGDGLPGELSRELKTSLCKEQGYLCAYCMSRIRPFKDNGTSGMRVEHWDSQSAAPAKTLEYSNMLGVCEGQYDDKIYTCDNFRGKPKHGNNGQLKFNPARKEDFAKLRIRYASDGRIFSEDEEFNKQLNDLLNLNADILCKNRKAKIDVLIQAFRKYGDGRELTKSFLQKKIADFTSRDEDGMLSPFCGVTIYYLNKRLERL